MVHLFSFSNANDIKLSKNRNFRGANQFLKRKDSSVEQYYIYESQLFRTSVQKTNSKHGDDPWYILVIMHSISVRDQGTGK
jgi:hypothetical protein